MSIFTETSFSTESVASDLSSEVIDLFCRVGLPVPQAEEPDAQLIVSSEQLYRLATMLEERIQTLQRYEADMMTLADAKQYAESRLARIERECESPERDLEVAKVRHNSFYHLACAGDLGLKLMLKLAYSGGSARTADCLEFISHGADSIEAFGHLVAGNLLQVDRGQLLLGEHAKRFVRALDQLAGENG